MCILSLNFSKSVLRENNHIWQRTDGWMSSLHEELLQVNKKNRQFNRKVREIHEHLFQRRGNRNGQKHEKMFKFISKQVNAGKTTMRCHFTCNKWAYVKVSKFQKYEFQRLVRMWSREHAHTWLWEYILEQSL